MKNSVCDVPLVSRKLVAPVALFGLGLMTASVLVALWLLCRRGRRCSSRSSATISSSSGEEACDSGTSSVGEAGLSMRLKRGRPGGPMPRLVAVGTVTKLERVPCSSTAAKIGSTGISSTPLVFRIELDSQLNRKDFSTERYHIEIDTYSTWVA